MPTVAELLEQSRAAHHEYRDNLPAMRAFAGAPPVLVEGDPVAARAALELAADLRKAANDADPDQLDPAWLVDGTAIGDHHDLLTFYAEQAALPEPADVLQAAARARKAGTVVRGTN